MKAIIIAAGMGQRLRPYTADRPKCMVEIKGRSLLERQVDAYRAAGIDWDVWIMPVGSTMEQQQEVQEAICIEAVDRGYNFSARVHSWVFGNKVGT